ncbi:MAG: carbohydrate ABC transporter permease [bacterium]
MKKIKISRVLIYMILILGAIVYIFPLFWLIRSSFLSSEEVFAIPMILFPERFRIENFKEALTAVPFIRYFFNTIFLVVMNVLGNIISSSMAAFGFSRIKFKGRNLMFALVLSTMMMPNTVLLIPQFFGWKLIGAYDTFYPLFMQSFFINGFFIFLLRQFFISIPKQYDEAAYLEGAGYFRIYTSIILPMSKPALMAVGVFTFMWTWNDFFGPLIYLSSKENYTLALGLQSFIGQYTSQWHYLMAASTIVVLPMIILFFLAQRYFIEGITLTGLKG